MRDARGEWSYNDGDAGVTITGVQRRRRVGGARLLFKLPSVQVQCHLRTRQCSAASRNGCSVSKSAFVGATPGR